MTPQEISKNYQPLPELGCYLWDGYIRPDGYGWVTMKRKTYFAHRVVYEFFNGPISDGLIIRHKCDNPACINPEHLEIGTHKDNAEDRVSRGRGDKRHGERNTAAKLTEKQAKEIKYSSERNVDLAEKYNVSQTTIHEIKKNKKWGHL